MVADELFDRGELGFPEWSVTPDPNTLVPYAIARERERESFRAKLDSNTGAVVVAHTDADGLTSAALLSEIAPAEHVVVQPVGYQDPYRFEHVLADLTDSESDFDPRNTWLLIADFNPDDATCADALSNLNESGCHIEWFDHHQWPDETQEAVVNAGVELYLDTDECAASLIQDITTPGGDEWDDQTQELVEVTKDRDLWINNDPRSPRLNVLARVLDSDEYITTVLEHGVDFPESIARQIDERIERDGRLETRAVERVRAHRIARRAVGVTYTSGGNTSNIGNELVEEHEPAYDIAVVGTPESVSFYSHSNRGVFARCHEVAGELGGGGHPTAAGCGIPADDFRHLADYWAQPFFETRAETKVLDAIAAVVEGDSA